MSKQTEMVLHEQNEIETTKPNYENSVEANLARVSIMEMTSESFDVPIRCS